jgi:hypothetical protein
VGTNWLKAVQHKNAIVTGKTPDDANERRCANLSRRILSALIRGSTF